MKFLIDGDHIVYRAAGSCEPTKLKPFLESKEDAIARTDSMMAQLFDDLLIADYELYIGGEGNWRKAIYPEYKANRKDKRLPTWLNDVREHLVTQYNAKIVNDIEVDDMCGIRLTEEGKHAVCISLDKDLLTVPGLHYNFVKKEYNNVSKVQALRYFYGQVITGDSSDNIPAFDGKLRNSVPQFVQKLLDPLQEMTEEIEMYNYVESLYFAFHEYEGSDYASKLMDRNCSVLYIQQYEGAKWSPPGQKLDVSLSL